MIKLTRLNGKEFVLNAELIRSIEALPDTTITLGGGDKLIVTAMLEEVVERAMEHTGRQELLLVGGVGANKRFCEMLDIMCKERGARFFKVPMDLAGDQGAMIAWEGFLRRESYGDIEVNSHWRADEV